MNPLSKIMLVYHEYTKTSSPEIDKIMQIATSKKTNFFSYPESKLTNYPPSILRAFIDAFLRLNTRPSFLFTVKIVLDIFISDPSIYIGLNHVRDHDKMIDKLIGKKVPWLYVKNDEVSNDAILATIQSSIIRESGFTSCSIVMNDAGLKKHLPQFIDVVNTIN